MIFNIAEKKELDAFINNRLSHFELALYNFENGRFKDNPDREKMIKYYKDKIEVINSIKAKVEMW